MKQLYASDSYQTLRLVDTSKLDSPSEVLYLDLVGFTWTESYFSNRHILESLSHRRDITLIDSWED